MFLKFESPAYNDAGMCLVVVHPEADDDTNSLTFIMEVTLGATANANGFVYRRDTISDCI